MLFLTKALTKSLPEALPLSVTNDLILYLTNTLIISLTNALTMVLASALMLALTNDMTLVLTKASPWGCPRLMGSFLLSTSLASCLPLATLRFCDAVVPRGMSLSRLTYGRRVMATPPSRGLQLRVGITQPVSGHGSVSLFVVKPLELPLTFLKWISPSAYL